MAARDEERIRRLELAASDAALERGELHAMFEELRLMVEPIIAQRRANHVRDEFLGRVFTRTRVALGGVAVLVAVVLQAATVVLLLQGGR